MDPASQWYQVVLNVISGCLSYTDHYTIRTLLDKHQASCVQDRAWDIKEINILVNSGEVMPVHGASFHLLLEISEPSRSPLYIMWSEHKDRERLQTSLGRPRVPSMTLNLFHSYLPFRTFSSLPFDYGNPTVSIKASLAFLLYSGLTPTDLNCFQHPRSGQQHLEAACLLVCVLCFTRIPLTSVPTSQTSWRLKRNSIFSLRSYSGRLKEEWLDRLTKGA